MHNRAFLAAFVLCLGSLLSSCGSGAHTVLPSPERTWDNAKLVSGPAEDSHYPSIAAGTTDSAIAVWVMTAGATNNVYSSRFESSSAVWGSPVRLSGDSPGGAWEPDLAMDIQGRAIAVWLQFDTGRVNIYALLYEPGKGWGTSPARISGGSGDAYYPQVTMDDTGGAMAIWQQQNGSRTDIFSNRYDGIVGAWGTPQPISTVGIGSTSLSGMPGRRNCIQADGGGNFYAVWPQFDNGSTGIWLNRFDARSGTWGVAQRIDTEPAEAAGPSLGLNGPGNVVVAWFQFEGNGADQSVWTRGYNGSTRTLEKPALIDNTTGSVANLQLAINGSGDGIAVWQRGIPLLPITLWASRYAAGGGWSPSMRIDDIDTADAYYPKIGLDSSGNGLVVWQQQDSGRSMLWARRYLAGSGWSPVEKIPAGDSGDSEEPALAVDPAGVASVIWLQPPGPVGKSVWANRLR